MTLTDGLTTHDVEVEPRPGPRAALPEWRIAIALARYEATRLGRASVLPLALAVLMNLGGGGDITDLRAASYNSAFTFLLPAAVALVVSHRAVTRSRRNGTDELLAAVPAPPRARTAAHLVAVLAPTALAAAVVVWLAWRLTTGATIGSLVLTELAVVPVLVAGAGCLGVLLARAWPQAFTPYLACLAIAAFELWVNTPRFDGSGARWLAFWVEGSLWWALPRPSAPHLVYLLGLVAMAAIGALLRHGATRRVVAVALAALAVTASAAAVQARQPQDHWRRVNAMFAQPASVQSCLERDGVRYCMFDPFIDLVGYLKEMVAAVRAVVPAQVWPDRLEVVQRITALDMQYAGDLHRWVPHLPDMPGGRIRQPADGAIHPGLEFGWSLIQQTGFGVQVASSAIGLPLVPEGDSTVCVAAGQARSVVALWAGAHASDEAAQGLALLVEDVERLVQPGAGRGTDAVLPVAGVDVYAGFAVSLADAQVALRLLDRQDLISLIGEHWQLFTDPATTTAQLVSALDLDGTVDTAAPGEPFLAHPDPAIVTLGAPCP